MARLNKNNVGVNVAHNAVVTSTTAKQISQPRSNRVTLSVRNIGANDVFLGGPGVTASTGYPLKPNEEAVYDDYVGELWAVGSATSEIRWIEVY